MKYFFTKTLEVSFDDAITSVTQKLKEKGFGILTEIDLKSTFKKKIDVDFYNYTILGACNPKLAYQALQAEEKIGLMLPCNVIVQQKLQDGKVEVSAIDPLVTMSFVENDQLANIASEVKSLLERVINEL